MMTHASTPIVGTAAPPLGSPRQPFTPFQGAHTDNADDVDAQAIYDDTVTQEQYDMHVAYATREPVQQFEGHNLLNVDQLRTAAVADPDTGQGYLMPAEHAETRDVVAAVDVHDDSMPQSIPSPTRASHPRGQYSHTAYTAAAKYEYEPRESADDADAPAHAHPRGGVPTPTQLQLSSFTNQELPDNYNFKEQMDFQIKLPLKRAVVQTKKKKR